MGWIDLHAAPRDAPVWLYLPAASFKADERGVPYEVTPGVLVAQWNKAQGAWIGLDGGRAVYPSLWHDADVSGPAPDKPVLS